jgi:prepilin-type N-terminal cleavage/methylation domain-containing protein/prepilin-type processing-associated H-X9-DG protein
MHQRRRGFSLVELLVVIGIIAVLLAILLPTITAARRQAEMVTCSTRLRQLVVACTTHAQEHRGYIPLAGELVGTPFPSGSGNLALAASFNDSALKKYTYVSCPPWGHMQIIVPLPAALAAPLGFVKRPADEWEKLETILNDETGVWRAFMCPSTRGADSPRHNFGAQLNIPEGQVTLVKASGGSMGYEWSSNTDYGPNEGIFGYHWESKNNGRRLNGNTVWLKNPSSVVMFTDAKGRNKASGLLNDPWICWTPSLTSTGPVTLADALLGNGKVHDKASFDHHRHRGKINVAFADGHVSTMRITVGDLSSAYLLPP